MDENKNVLIRIAGEKRSQKAYLCLFSFTKLKREIVLHCIEFTFTVTGVEST